MSISSEITRINGNIADAYDAIEEKGGTLPSVQNSENLADAIDSIEIGTPRSSSDLTVSGATVNVPAGLYSANASKSVASGSLVSKVDVPITVTGDIQMNSWITGGLSAHINVETDGAATNVLQTPGYIDAQHGKIVINGEAPTYQATYNLSLENKTITENGHYEPSRNSYIFFVDVNVPVPKERVFSPYTAKIISSPDYVDTGISVTIPKTGNYRFTWFNYINNSAAPARMKLQKNGVDIGSEHTPPLYSAADLYCEYENHVPCVAGDVVKILAKSGTFISTYFITVLGLIAEELEE